MARDVRDHPANRDEADRHHDDRRVPLGVAVAVAVAVVALLALLNTLGWLG